MHIHTHTHTYIHTQALQGPLEELDRNAEYVRSIIAMCMHTKHAYIRVHIHIHIHTYIHTYIHRLCKDLSRSLIAMQNMYEPSWRFVYAYGTNFMPGLGKFIHIHIHTHTICIRIWDQFYVRPR
jgi:hypothetical protein